MYSIESVRKDLNRQASPADPNSSSGSSYGNQSGYSLSQEPMSLDERRKRNKAASAKYRAKKQIQISQMSSEISLLTEENTDLQKRLRQVRDDNERLRAKLMVLQSQTDQALNAKCLKRSRDSDHIHIY
jgi:cell shape-determining protein MreC